MVSYVRNGILGIFSFLPEHTRGTYSVQVTSGEHVQSFQSSQPWFQVGEKADVIIGLVDVKKNQGDKSPPKKFKNNKMYIAGPNLPDR